MSEWLAVFCAIIREETAINDKVHDGKVDLEGESSANGRVGKLNPS